VTNFQILIEVEPRLSRGQVAVPDLVTTERRVFTVTVALCLVFVNSSSSSYYANRWVVRQRTFARRHATLPTALQNVSSHLPLRLSTEADENLKNGAITPPHTFSASLARAGVENCPTTSSSPSFKSGAILLRATRRTRVASAASSRKCAVRCVRNGPITRSTSI
jgi:hypothetical protein